MNYIKSFKDYDKVDEGLKQNILAGIMSLFLSYGSMASNKTHTATYKQSYNQDDSLKMKSDIEKRLKNGWKLSASEIDTIWNKLQTDAPDTIVETLSLKIDNSAFFESGRFELSEDIKLDIDSALQEILDNQGMISSINIKSSTDKQGLSTNLQKILKDKGLTPDNKGLSKARSLSVENYLSNNINKEIINIENLSEQGQTTIDQSSRCVYINFNYVVVKNIPSNNPSSFELKNKLIFKKEIDNKINTKLHFKSKHIKQGPIKNKKRGSVDCVVW